MKTKLVYGVGINDADYVLTKQEKVNGKWKIVWSCPYYERWNKMLCRCYSKKYQVEYPTYKGCSVCEEWLTFSTFKKWMETQNWENRALDKDFLIEGNKVYSPTTCVFLPNKLNCFIITSGKTRGEHPLGVFYQKKSKRMVNELSKPYKCQIHNQTNKQVYLGTYSTSEEAHRVYLGAKLAQCVDYLEEFKEEPLIIKGLTRVREKIQYYIDNKLELTSF